MTSAVRDALTGIGPWPDRRVAVDGLDCLRALLQAASPGRQRAVAGELLDLFGDPDPVVATLRGEVLRRAAEVVRPDQRRALARIGAAVEEPELRGWLVGALASSVPDLVVANAARWGRLGETGPRFRLRSHQDRVRFARALAPWPADSIAHLAHRQRACGWTAAELAELAAVMASG
jgi:hypothetical protein